MTTWKLIISSILCLFLSIGYGQDVSHKHSIYHAFVENKGQWHKEVLFKSQFEGGNLWVQQHKFLFHIQDFSETKEMHANFDKKPGSLMNRQTVVHLNFLNSNEVNNVQKANKTDHYYNFFLGNDRDKWASDVHGFGEAILKDLYDNIDLKLIEQEEQLKYEFHVHPKADPSIIRLEYAGHEKLDIDKEGNLIVKTSLGKIIEQKPYAYQIVNGNIREVVCDFMLDGDEVQFALGSYNPTADLIIDPVLIFATYSGSVTDNFGMTATYAYDGTAFSGGTIYGNSYPTPDNNAYDVTSNFTVVNNGSGSGYGVTDVFISHYSADGTNMIWTTFIGGGNDTTGTETVHSLICDQNNNIYLFGATSSTDFPIQGGYQGMHGGGVDLANFYQNGVYYKTAGTDIYVAKFSANGQNLLGSTYIGGSGNDGVNYKWNMPVNTSNGTYYNAAQYDSLTSNYGDQFRGEIMLDGNGDCIVASCTKSSNFPTLNAFQPTLGGKQDGVVFKLSADLSTLMWSSFYGGSDNDACYSVKVDSSQNIVFSGGTCSNDLIGINGWQMSNAGGKADGFVAKLIPAGTAITNASYVGTANYDQAFFCEIDRDDNVFLVGQSQGGNFPVNNAVFVNPGGSQFVIKLDPTLSTNMNSTVFGSGGSTPDISPAAFLVDICGNIYISGWGANLLQSFITLSGMPVTADALYSTPPNGFDFYLLVIEREMNGILYGSYFGEPGNIREHVDGGTSRFDKDGIVYQSVCGACGNGAGYTSGFVTTPDAWSTTDLGPNCNNLLFKFDFELIPNADFTIDGNSGCAPYTVTFNNESSETDSYVWDFGNGTQVASFDSVLTATYDTAGVYDVYLYATDSVCLITDTAHATITVSPPFELSTLGDTILCSPEQISMMAISDTAGVSYVWSSSNAFNDTLSLDSVLVDIPPNEPTIYYVEGTFGECSLYDSVYINYEYNLLDLNLTDSICVGETTTVSVTNSSSTITFNYTWSPDSIMLNPGSSSSTITIDPQVTQYVYLDALSSTGCLVEDSVLVHVGNVSGAAIASASEYVVPVGGETTLYGEPGGYSYLWSPSEFVVNATAQQTQTTALDQTTLFVLYVSQGACTKSDTVLIHVYNYICGKPYVYVPNAFSPNGDGENEILYVRGPNIASMEFKIFDRWGELVFETQDRSVGWNGEFRGKAMDPDVYDYYLRVVCIDGYESIIKGNITLLR